MVVYVQEMSPWPQMFFIVKRRPYSQAGRRRFESGLPLHNPPIIFALGGITPLGEIVVTPQDSTRVFARFRLWCSQAEFFEEDGVAFLCVTDELVEGDDVDVHAEVVVVPEVSCAVSSLS